MGIYWFIIFLGVIQGLTEFLPISSSGHLALIQNLDFFREYSKEVERFFSLLQFNIFLHFGTLMAVFIYWRKDIINLIRHFFQSLFKKDYENISFKESIGVIIGTIPVLLVPLYKDFVENSASSLYFISAFFIFNGFLLSITDLAIVKKNTQRNTKDLSKLKFYEYLIIGFFQIMAVFPGISRSGSTISAGLILKMKGEDAVRYSFLLSIPVLVAANLLELKDLSQIDNIRMDYLLTGLLASFLAGLFSIRILVWLGKKLIIYPFGLYTLLLGVWILAVYL